MNKTSLEEQNNVTAKNQVSEYITYEGVNGGSPKIMFVGNSITKHAPKPEIGWYGNWGMAASSKEKDYVHLVMTEIQKTKPNAEFCIVQASNWELNYKNCDYDKYFKDAVSFIPDIIICCISANIPKEEFETDAFKENVDKLFKYLSGENKNVKIFESSSFFGNPEKCKAIREYAEEYGVTYVEISDIVKDETNLAIGNFEHEGVQIHPGDKGMKIIAERILRVIEL